MHVENNSSLSSESKNVQSLQENVHSLAKAIKEVSSSILELTTSLYRLQEHLEAFIKQIPIENQVEVQLLGENIKICDIKGNKKHSSAKMDGTFQSNLSNNAASGTCEPQFNRINQNVPLELVEDMYEGNSPVKDYPFREIDIEKEEKIEIHESPVDSALTRQESKRELQNITLNETSDDDYTHEHSSDEVNDEVQLRSVASTIIWSIDHAATNQRQDGKFVRQSVLKKIDRFKGCFITLQKEAPMTVDFKGVLEEPAKSIKMENVRQRTDRTKNLPMKIMQRSTEVDDIISSLPKEMGNVKSSREHDKNSSDTIQWYMNWSDKRLPVRDNLYFVFALPFVVSLRVIPLPPRRFFVQNNMYQYEYARLASFSTYEGRGFRILFAQAGFVFDPVTNMVVCPWCSVFVHDYDVSIRLIHLSDCMFLQINIPLHNAPRIPGRADNLQNFMQAGSVDLSSALVHAQNRHSIEISGSRIRSEQAATLSVTENEGIRLQENALMVLTEPRTCPNIRQASPAVFCCSHTRSKQNVGLNNYQGKLQESSTRFQSEQTSPFSGALRNRVRPHDSAMTVSTNPATCGNSYHAAPRVSYTRIRPGQPNPLATSLKECVRSQDHVERVAPKANIGPNNHQTIPPVSYTRNRPKQTSALPVSVKTGVRPYGCAVKKSIKSSIDLESYQTPRQESCSRLRSEQTPNSPVTRKTDVRPEENPTRVSTKPLFSLNNPQARPLVSCSNIRPQKTPVVENKGVKLPDNRKRSLIKPSVDRNSSQGEMRVFCSKTRSEQAPILSVPKKKDVRPQGNSPRVSTKPSVCGDSFQGKQPVSFSRCRSEQKSLSPVVQEKGVRPQENAMRVSTNPTISANCHQLATRVSCTRRRSRQTPALPISAKKCARLRANALIVATEPIIGPNNHRKTPPIFCTVMRQKKSKILPISGIEDVRSHGDVVKESIKSSIDLDSQQKSRQISYTQFRSRQESVSDIAKKGIRTEDYAKNISSKTSTGLNCQHATSMAFGKHKQTNSCKHAKLSASTSDKIESSLASLQFGTDKNGSISTNETGLLNEIHASAQNSVVPSVSTKHDGYSTDASTINGASWMETARVSCDENDQEAAEDAENKETEQISTLPDGTVGLVAASASCFCQEETLNYLLTEVTQGVQNVGDQSDVPVKHTLIGLREERREGGGKNPDQ